LRNRTKNGLFLLANFIFCYITLEKEWNNSEVALQLIFSFFIHSLAFRIASNLLKSVKIPYILLLSFSNIITLSIAPLLVDFSEFQLGEFNPFILDVYNFGFILFYLIHFLIVYNKINKPIEFKKQSINIGRLQFIVFLIYVIQIFAEIEISGVDEMIQFYTIGVFMYGYVNKKNNLLQNIILIAVILFRTTVVITYGLIYPVFYLVAFIVLTMYIFGALNRRVIILGTFFLSTMVTFSILFSPVKMQYRSLDTSGYSITKKVSVINDLITDNRIENQKEDNDEKEGPLWRLTYPLSAFSLVYEKTPKQIPFWEGESYVNIFYKFIPRIIWPGKPKEDMGQRFGHRYSILADDNLTTSMNTPILAEAYMNFGFVFVFITIIFLAILMSYLFLKNNLKTNNKQSIESVLNDLNICIVAVIFLQWESNLSMMIGKIIIILITTKILTWLYFRKQLT